MRRTISKPSPVPLPTGFVVKNGSKIRDRTPNLNALETTLALTTLEYTGVILATLVISLTIIFSVLLGYYLETI